MMTDPIADMLARIRNASMARHERTEMPLSKLKVSIAEILQQEGYVHGFSLDEGAKTISVQLKYHGRDRQSAISGIRRASRPGRRVYVGHGEIPKVQNGTGISILSTSQGVMTDRSARDKHVGGEILCEVW
jgi:small subunit ribosomal protein S8